MLRRGVKVNMLSSFAFHNTAPFSFLFPSSSSSLLQLISGWSSEKLEKKEEEKTESIIPSKAFLIVWKENK